MFSKYKKPANTAKTEFAATKNPVLVTAPADAPQPARQSLMRAMPQKAAEVATAEKTNVARNGLAKSNLNCTRPFWTT